MANGAVSGSGVNPRAAVCATGGSLAALFFSDQLDEIALARAICETCPEIVPCLDGALARREACGVWGGQLFMNGTVLARKRPRGRPRKNEVVAQPA